MAPVKTRMAVIRKALRWGSREVARREIEGDWPAEIEREGVTFRPAGPDHDMPLRTERHYYEVLGDDD